MSAPPARPSIYHITHIDNLAGIVTDGGISSDSVMVGRGGPAVSIGMSKVKADRLAKDLDCHPGSKVGEFVPFNFCPRSVMLYVIYARSHPSLPYRGGQDPIVHLVADFERVADWADLNGIPWAITDVNSRAEYAQSFASRAGLSQLDWPAIANHDFRDMSVKQAKQAEFLIRAKFPWELVEHVGTHSLTTAAEVAKAIGLSRHKPSFAVERSWYY